MNNPNITQFNYCPGCGKKTFDPGCEKSFVCSSCHYELYMNAASACVALIFKGDKLLVTERKNNPAKGSLDLPGGFADPGETIESALTREIKEELNLTIDSLEYLFSLPNQYLYKSIEYATVDMVFKCRVSDFSPITARDDINGYHFIDIDALNENQFGLNSIKILIMKLKQDQS